MYRLRVLVIFIAGISLALLSTSTLKAQNNINIGVTTTDELIACGEPDTLSFRVSNNNSDNIEDVLVEIQFPTGVFYVPKSAQTTLGGAVSENNVANLNHIWINLPDLKIGEVVEFFLLKRANCQAIGSITVRDSINLTAQTVGPPVLSANLNAVSDAYNIRAADVSITAINPDPIEVTMGQPFTRTFTITNGGAYIDNFYITDLQNDLPILAVNGAPLNATNDTIFVSAATLAGAPGGVIPTELEKDETFVIEITQLATDCSQLGSTLEVGWGCDNEICLRTTRDASVLPADGRPRVDIEIQRTTLPNPCVDAPISITYTNTGINVTGGADSLAAIANDMTVRLGWWRWWVTTNVLPNTPYADLYPNDTERVRIHTASINGTPVNLNVPTYANRNEGYTLDFSSIAGPLMGLDDLDGDGEFDDLGVGESFTLDFFVDVPCQTDCPETRESEIDGKRLFTYLEVPSEQCNLVLDDTVHWTNGSGNFQSLNRFDLDDDTRPAAEIYPNSISDGQTITAELCFDHTRRQFSCSQDEVFMVIEQPAGYTVQVFSDPCTGAASPGGLVADYTTYPDSVIIRSNYDMIDNDTSQRYNDACFVLNITLDCSAPGFDPNQTLEYTIYYDCEGASCPCLQKFRCGSLNMTTNCPVPCAAGMNTPKLTLARNTFGWTDYTMNTPIYPGTLTPAQDCALLKDRAMPTDTLRLQAKGVVNSAAGYNEVSLTLGHNFGSALFEVVDGSFDFYDVSTAASLTNQPLPAATAATAHADGLTLTFNAAQGLPLMELGDSLVVDAYLTVRKNANLDFIPTGVPGLSAFFYGNNGGTLEACDTTLLNMELHAPYYRQVNINWNSGVRFTQCHDRNAEMQLFTRENDYAHYYPGEFRPYFHHDSVVIVLPENYTYEISSGRYQNWNVQGFGHPNNDFLQYEVGSTNTNRPASLPNFPTPTITSTAGQTRISFDGSFFYFAEVGDGNDQGERFFLRFTLNSENCTTPLNDEIRLEWHLDNYFYSRAASAHEALLLTDDEEIFTAKQPLSLNLPAGKLDEATTPFEFFDITICNDQPNAVPSGGNFEADSVWVSFTPAAGGTQIEAVERLSDNQFMPLASYGSGQYWAKLSRFDYTECQAFRVYYEYTICTPEDLYIETSWDCVYPTDPSTTRALECNITRDTLQVDPKPVALQAEIVQVDSAFICDVVDYQLIITNTNRQYVKNLIATVNPPPGTAFVPGSAKITFPQTATAVALADPVANSWDLDAIWPLPGDVTRHEIAGVEELDSNKIVIDFQIELTCNYTIGIPPSFEVAGTKHCGDPVSTGLVVATPPKIKGVIEPYGATIDINAGAPLEINSCNGTATMRMSMLNQGPGNTTQADSMVFILPPGMEYVTGSFTQISNSPPSGTAPVEFTAAGQDSLKWRILPNVSPGFSNLIEFTFDVRATPQAICADGQPLAIYSTTLQGLYCPATNDTCDVTVVTTSNTALVNHQKADLEVSLTQNVIHTNGTQFFVQGEIRNTGAVATAPGGSPNSIVRFYCDNNPQNGLYDPGENLLATYETTTNIPPGGTHSFSQTFTLDPTDPTQQCPGITDAPGVAVMYMADTTDVSNPTLTHQCICDDYVGALNIILPVTWLHFSGEAKKEGNQLFWNVVEDDFTGKYHVQHYIESKAKWETLTEVTALGSPVGSTERQYQWLHPSPEKLEYYRIMAVSLDEAPNVSKTIELHNKAPAHLRVYPNPTANELFVEAPWKEYHFEVIDALGRVWNSGKHQGAGATLKLPTQTLATGRYVLRLRHSLGVEQISFIKE